MIDPRRFTILRLPRALRREIEFSALRRYPAESCGVLIGRVDGAWAEVSQVISTRNLALQERRYEIHPEDLLAAHDSAERLGMRVVGVWHSHPDCAAEPSAQDRIAAQRDWSYLIVEVGAEGARELRSWRLEGAEFVEEDVRA